MCPFIHSNGIEVYRHIQKNHSEINNVKLPKIEQNDAKISGDGIKKTQENIIQNNLEEMNSLQT